MRRCWVRSYSVAVLNELEDLPRWALRARIKRVLCADLETLFVSNERPVRATLVRHPLHHAWLACTRKGTVEVGSAV